MKAMLMHRIVDLQKEKRPLSLGDLPVPVPKEGEILVRVLACGVCHTELDEIEGRTPPPVLPMILGHQVVGRVEALGPGVTSPARGIRVGIGWIRSACRACPSCLRGEENLCPSFEAMGRDAPGGYAEFTTVPAAFAYPLPDGLSDEAAAPLLCAGAIGYRSLRLTGLRNGQSLGLTGFGASAHLVLKMVRHLYPEATVYVFARSQGERRFAMELGARWAGDTQEAPPVPLDAVIDTTPAWGPVLAALACLRPGGRLVINAIRKEEGDRASLLRLDYPAHLWLEKEIKSVANVARRDISEFLTLAATMAISPEIALYPLDAANQALVELKERRIRGAKVLKIGG